MHHIRHSDVMISVIRCNFVLFFISNHNTRIKSSLSHEIHVIKPSLFPSFLLSFFPSFLPSFVLSFLPSTLSYTSFHTHTHTYEHTHTHSYIQILGVELSIHNAVHRMYTDSCGNIRPESELPSPWQYLYRVQESGSQADKKCAAKRG